MPQPTRQSPGGERVQFYMASLLATLVLDQEAMAALQARGDGPPMFRTTLHQLARSLGRLKAARAAEAVPEAAAEGAGEARGDGGSGGDVAASPAARGGSAGYRGALVVFVFELEGTIQGCSRRPSKAACSLLGLPCACLVT